MIIGWVGKSKSGLDVGANVKVDKDFMNKDIVGAVTAACTLLFYDIQKREKEYGPMKAIRFKEI